MEEQLTVKLAELEQRTKSNTRRVEALERGQEALNRLTTAVEVLVREQQRIREDLGEVGRKLDAVEKRPMRRWEAVTEKLLLVLVSALATYVLTGVGL